MQLANPMQTCHAHARGAGGRQCRNYPLPGQRVCRMHGGRSPQALAKAQERLRALVHPAIDCLERALAADANPHLAFAAARLVLEYAGFKAVEKVQSDSVMNIVVVYEEHPLPASNGHVLDPRY